MLSAQPLHEVGQPAARDALGAGCPQKRVVVRHTCLPVVFVNSLRMIMQTNRGENRTTNEPSLQDCVRVSGPDVSAVRVPDALY